MENFFDPLTLPVIGFNAPIVSLLFKLERLRGISLSGTTPTEWFFQLKESFQLLEALGSSRIEGNNTTVIDYVTREKSHNDENFTEISNLENALKFIEKSTNPIDEDFICNLQKIAVSNLVIEGDTNAGHFRDKPIYIPSSNHEPPEPYEIPKLMKDLVRFIQKKCDPQYDLLKVCIAHHRLVWIHPFFNGNGRTARLLTYAMILRLFNVHQERLFNPTAVFCENRNKYYKMLAIADSGNNEAIITWCEFVLKGLLEELQKTEKLTDLHYVKTQILEPAIQNTFRKKIISKEFLDALLISLQRPIFQAADLSEIWADSFLRSRNIRKLQETELIAPIKTGARKYMLNFSSGPLLREIMFTLHNLGFFSESLMGH